MDWFSWLSRTGLDPSLVYAYGVTMSHNELEEEDILYFTHDLLHSIGISVANHSLQIINLAKKPPHSISTLLARHVRSCTCREGSSSALPVVPTTRYRSLSSRWRGSMVKRTKKKELFDHGRLLLTDGCDGFSSVHPTAGDEEIKWDTMFQDLKPT